MAKKGSSIKSSTGINKSQAIRDYMAEHPDAAPKAIRLALYEQGIEVTDGLVGVVKYGGKKSSPKKAAAPRKVGRRAPAGLTAHDLMDVKQLANRLGGIAQLRIAIDMLEKLS